MVDLGVRRERGAGEEELIAQVPDALLRHVGYDGQVEGAVSGPSGAPWWLSRGGHAHLRKQAGSRGGASRKPPGLC